MQTCFISYRREDKRIADRVYQRLKQYGIDVWMDKPPAPFREAGIPAGQLWDDMILTELRDCFAFLPIFTSRDVEPDSYFTKELRMAVDLHREGTAAKVVLPVLSGVPVVPPLPDGISFSAFQWVDLLEDGLGAVVSALKPALDAGPVSHDEITVRSTDEFIAAIGSNRTLLLDMPELDLTLTGPLPSGLAFVSAEDVHDGHQLTIHSVENLEIRPKGSDLAHLHVSPRYAFALDFHDCRNVRLDRLRMGHQPETGSCIGGVLQGQKVRNLAVSDCILYGCGTSGFELSDAEQVTIDRCVVEECTSHLSSFRFCTGVAVRETVFRRNEVWGGLRFENCGQIEVRESGFEDNRRVWSEQTAMISAHRSRDIWFRDCWAHGNDFAAVEANAGSVQFSNCRWEGFGDGA